MTWRAKQGAIPPGSTGQLGPAYPLSKSVACQDLVQGTFPAGSRGRLPGALSARKARIRSRNSSSVASAPGRTVFSMVGVVISVLPNSGQGGHTDTVLGGGAEQQLGRLGALEVEVRVLPPPVADAPVDLAGLFSCVGVGRGAHCMLDCGGHVAPLTPPP